MADLTLMTLKAGESEEGADGSDEILKDFTIYPGL